MRQYRYLSSCLAISIALLTPLATSAVGVGGSGTTNYISKWTNSTNLGNSLLYDNGSNVGIGTTIPATRLDIMASSSSYPVRFRYSSAETTYAELVSSTNGIGLAARNVAAGYGIQFYTSTGTTNTEVMRITDTGKVGIGVTSPSQKLDVAGYVKGTGLCIGADCRTSWPTSNTGTVTGSGTSGYISQWSGISSLANSPLYVSNGNVGIGTSSPTERLVVNNPTAGAKIIVNGNDGLYSLSMGADSNSPWIGSQSNDDFRLVTNGGERMRITKNGAVGIGTITPAYTLDVNGSIRGTSVCISTDCRTSWPMSASADTVTGSGGTNYLSKWTSATNLGNSVMYDNGDKVGIKTVSPKATLDVNGDLRVARDDGKYVKLNPSGEIKAYSDTDGGFMAVGIGDENFIGLWDQGAPHLLWKDDQGDPLTIRYDRDGQDLLTVTSDGKIGIGTTDPHYLLDVAGSIKGNQVCLGSDCRAEWPASGEDNPWEANGSMIYYNQGNVGIGTTNPGYKLDVQDAKNSLAVQVKTEAAGGYSQFRLSNPERDFILTNNAGDDLLSFYYGAANRLQFDLNNQWFSQGNVGIGTAAPTPHYEGAAKALIVAGEDGERAIIEAWGQKGGKALLQSVDGNTYIGNVEDGTNTAAGNTYIVRGDGTRAVTLSGASGNVGINTNEPSQRLTVSGGGIKLDNNQAILWRDQANTLDHSVILYNTENKLLLRPGAADQVTIRGTDGYVGIGTTDPKYLLDVAGTVRSSELCLNTDCRKTWPTSPWETYENFIYSATSVGIKTAPGNNALGVSGDVEISGKVLASTVNANTFQVNYGELKFYDTADMMRGAISASADGLDIYANTVTSLNSELYIRHNVGIGTVPADSKTLVVDGNDTIGIAVTTDNNIAIDATSGSSQAITAENNSSSVAAIEGYNPAGMGIAGLSQNGYGIYGWSKNSYAGYFDGAVSIIGNLRVKGGDICLGNCL